MRRKESWVNLTRNKLENLLHHHIPTSTRYDSDKLPPRIQKNGISVAARVVGNEIRNFTKKTTGKDLAQLRNSRTRQLMLTKFSAIRVAVTNKQTQYQLLALACDTGSNLVTSLSPEGPECDYNFKNNTFMRDFIAQYHQQCSDFQTVPDLKPPLKLKKRDKILSQLEQKPKISEVVVKRCRCGSIIEDEKKANKLNFLGCWLHKGIDEDEVENYWNENVSHFLQENKKQLHQNPNNEWSHFLDNEKYVVFRRRLNCGLYEYRVQATFPDISAQKLFQTQVDGPYRRKWDDYVLQLDVVDSDKQTSTDLVHWVTKCPYPFSTREYIYLRRSKIDLEKKFMLLYSKATDNTDIPNDKQVERVETYVSKLIIKPHQEFDKNGCDFLLTYYDDPKMMLPQRVLDVAASKGISQSMLRMYRAAVMLNEMEKKEK